MNTKSKLKKYNITHKDIAKSFGYSSEVSFNNSHKKEVILNTIEENMWSEVHFYEDKESWLYSAQAAVNERFPEVKFFPHLIATTRHIGSL